mmetsp:Transcript_64025/g.198221  ORF Transcript_64025/g.198221 Transcript_64025/m.198221 type:complete len:269 (-) Transcript_64025:166-972(-)
MSLGAATPSPLLRVLPPLASGCLGRRVLLRCRLLLVPALLLLALALVLVLLLALFAVVIPQVLHEDIEALPPGGLVHRAPHGLAGQQPPGLVICRPCSNLARLEEELHKLHSALLGVLVLVLVAGTAVAGCGRRLAGRRGRLRRCGGGGLLAGSLGPPLRLRWRRVLEGDLEPRPVVLGQRRLQQHGHEQRRAVWDWLINRLSQVDSGLVIDRLHAGAVHGDVLDVQPMRAGVVRPEAQLGVVLRGATVFDDDVIPWSSTNAHNTVSP